jgi:hypothetical protein
MAIRLSTTSLAAFVECAKNEIGWMVGGGNEDLMEAVKCELIVICSLARSMDCLSECAFRLVTEGTQTLP